MKRLVLILSLIAFSSVYAQDSIVNYLDNKGEIVKKKLEARYIETVVKKDTLWQVTKYSRNGKLIKRGFFKTKEKKIPVGEFVTMHKNGKLSKIIYYNEFGKKVGQSKSWFDDGKTNHTGIYQNGEKAGVWKYYHLNGKEACRQYYVDGKLLKTVLYNENGEIVEAALIENEPPKYKGGTEEFIKRIKRLHGYVDYQVVGKIFIDFKVGIDGKISEVTISDEIPKGLERQIRIFLENSDEWQPAIHMHRKIPYNYNLPLSFSVEFNEK